MTDAQKREAFKAGFLFGLGLKTYYETWLTKKQSRPEGVSFAVWSEEFDDISDVGFMVARGKLDEAIEQLEKEADKFVDQALIEQTGSDVIADIDAGLEDYPAPMGLS